MRRSFIPMVLSRTREVGGQPQGISGVVFLGWQFFLRDFRIHYRPAILGVGWSLAPLVALSIAFSAIAAGFNITGLPEGVPYPAFILSGLIVWLVFADGLTTPVRMVRRSRTMLRHVPFDYRALIAAGTYYVFFYLLTRLPVLALLFVVFSLSVPATLPLSVVPLLGMLAFGLAIGVIVAPISLVYLDIRYALPYVGWVLFAVTPVAYPLPSDGLLRDVNLANPLTYLVTMAREWMLVGNGAFANNVWLLTPIAAGMLLLALYFYEAKIRIGIERIYLRTRASDDRLRALYDIDE